MQESNRIRSILLNSIEMWNSHMSCTFCLFLVLFYPLSPPPSTLGQCWWLNFAPVKRCNVWLLHSGGVWGPGHPGYGWERIHCDPGCASGPMALTGIHAGGPWGCLCSSYLWEEALDKSYNFISWDYHSSCQFCRDVTMSFSLFYNNGKQNF